MKGQAISAAAAVALATAAFANDYPSRAVTFVVPYAAGGATDLLARTLGQNLEQKLGKPFVIENRLGAASAIAATYVSKASPDGYTILMATSTTMAINPAMHSNLGYKPLEDLAPVALIADSPFVLVVNNNLPVKSVPDLVALAKSKPDQLTYASSGPGSAHHLDMQLLASMTGIKLTHVVYKGTVPALNDVVAGHVQMMFADMSAALPLIRGGQVRAIGVSTAKRLAAASDLPTIAEAGLPGYDAAAWQMVVMPSKTPNDIVDRLHASLKDLQGTEAFRDTVLQRGMAPLVTPSRPDLKVFVENEMKRWGKVVRDAGVAN